jgi:hypothetical protein
MVQNKINLCKIKAEIEKLRRSHKVEVVVSSIAYRPGCEPNAGVTVFFFDVSKDGSSKRKMEASIKLISFSEEYIRDVFFNGAEPAKENLAAVANFLNAAFPYIASRIGEELERKKVKGIVKKDWEKEQRKFLSAAEFFLNEDHADYIVELGRNSMRIFPPSQIVSPEELKRRTVRISIIQRKKKEEN